MNISFGGTGGLGTFSEHYKIIKKIKGQVDQDKIEYSVAEDKDFKRYNVKKIIFKDPAAADDCCFEV